MSSGQVSVFQNHVPLQTLSNNIMDFSTSTSPQTINPSLKRRRNQARESSDSDTEVVALSAETLMATNKFICECCGKAFPRDQNLQLHIRQHNLPWTKLLQQQHQPFQSTMDIYNCTTSQNSNSCGSTAACVGSGSYGVNSTTGTAKKRVYICPEETCVHHHKSRALGDLTGIKKHFSRKHGERKWKCPKCSKSYAVQSDWKAHTKICGNREFLCNFCGMTFARKDKFTKHTDYCKALAEEKARVNNELSKLDSSGVPTSTILVSSSTIPVSTLTSPAASPQPTLQLATSSINSPKSDISSISVDGLIMNTIVSSTACSTTSTEPLAASGMQIYLNHGSSSWQDQRSTARSVEDQTISGPDNVGFRKASLEKDIESNSCTLSLWFTANNNISNTLELTPNNSNVTVPAVCHDQQAMKSIKDPINAFHHQLDDVHHSVLGNKDKTYRNSIFQNSRSCLQIHDQMQASMSANPCLQAASTAASDYGYQMQMLREMASTQASEGMNSECLQFPNASPFLSMPCLLYTTPATDKAKDTITRDFLGVGSFA